MLVFYLAALENEGERRQFSELYTRYYSQMAAVAARYFPGDPASAEDAVHNAFLQVIRHFSKISEISRDEIPFWLVSIVKNESITLRRKHQRLVPLMDWAGPAAPGGEDYLLTVELIRQMPETYRSALEMRFVEERSYQEIAQALGLSETAVKSRVSRGRTLLLRQLEEG